MKYLEMVKINKNFKQRPHAQLLARGEKLKKLFFQRTALYDL